MGSACGIATSFMPTADAAAATRIVQGTSITPAFMGWGKKLSHLLSVPW